MEPNLAQQQNQIPQEQMSSSPQQQTAYDAMVPNLNTLNTSKNKSLGTCLSIVIPIVFLLVFFFLGGKIFDFFHLTQVYHFIMACIILFILYIIFLALSGIFFKVPKDILSIGQYRGRS